MDLDIDLPVFGIFIKNHDIDITLTNGCEENKPMNINTDIGNSF